RPLGGCSATVQRGSVGDKKGSVLYRSGLGFGRHRIERYCRSSAWTCVGRDNPRSDLPPWLERQPRPHLPSNSRWSRLLWTVPGVYREHSFRVDGRKWGDWYPVEHRV